MAPGRDGKDETYFKALRNTSVVIRRPRFILSAGKRLQMYLSFCFQGSFNLFLSSCSKIVLNFDYNQGIVMLYDTLAGI